MSDPETCWSVSLFGRRTKVYGSEGLEFETYPTARDILQSESIKLLIWIMLTRCTYIVMCIVNFKFCDNYSDFVVS